MAESPYDHATLTLLDGRQYRFQLSMGGLRRVKQRFGISDLAELLKRDIAELSTLLYEALPKAERAAISEEDFVDLVPVDVDLIGKTVLKLFNVSFPDAPVRPPEEGGTEALSQTGPPSGASA